MLLAVLSGYVSRCCVGVVICSVFVLPVSVARSVLTPPLFSLAVAVENATDFAIMESVCCWPGWTKEAHDEDLDLRIKLPRRILLHAVQ